MRMKARSASVSAFSRLLASICLRYGVAKPSVWPRKRGCNRRQFSDFRSDSPLNFTSFGCRFGDVGEPFRVCRFLVLQSSSFSISVFTFQSTARCSSVYFSWALPCLVLRWRSCANRLTSGNRFTHEFAIQIWLRVRMLGINVALAATSMEHQRVALDLARC